MTEYRLDGSPRGAGLVALLRFLRGFTAVFGVVVSEASWTNDARWQPSMRRAVEALEPHLASRGSVREWPGTVAFRDHVRSLYRVSDASIETFASLGDSLGDWVQPFLPADPHFLRADGSVALGSACCGEVVWLDLLGVEVQALPPGLEQHLA